MVWEDSDAAVPIRSEYEGLPTFRKIAPDARESGCAWKRVVLDLRQTAGLDFRCRAEYGRATARRPGDDRSHGIVEPVDGMRERSEFVGPAGACPCENDVDFVIVRLSLGGESQTIEGASERFFAVLWIG